MTEVQGSSGNKNALKRRLKGVRLRVTELLGLVAFYRDILGMTVFEQGEVVCLGYDQTGAQLELQLIETDRLYRYSKTDEYWKIGITLPDVDLACRCLRDKGIEVSDPVQFGDIGYMCHLCDPHGHCIELLQHTFKGQDKTGEGDRQQCLGGGARIGQITLRTLDIESALEHYVNKSGMKLLSVQDVKGYDFTLYFLGFTADAVPDDDLYSVANRPWLYQRPYTTLEFQSLTDTSHALKKTGEGEPGFAGLSFD